MSGALTELGNTIKGEKGYLKDGEETALCKDGEYYILEGDWRKEYGSLAANGFEACKEMYDREKKEYGSNWSTDTKH